jgi:hypothetical protein
VAIPARCHVHQGSALRVILNAKPLWVPTPKETTPTPVHPRAVRSPAPPRNLAPTSAIPCSRTSSMGRPAKGEGGVRMGNAQVQVSAKRSRAGLTIIRHWSLLWHPSLEDSSYLASYHVAGVDTEGGNAWGDALRQSSSLLPRAGLGTGCLPHRWQGGGAIKPPTMATQMSLITTGKMGRGRGSNRNRHSRPGSRAQASDMRNDSIGIWVLIQALGVFLEKHRACLGYGIASELVWIG